MAKEWSKFYTPSHAESGKKNVKYVSESTNDRNGHQM